jgi:hypothetical protein
MKPCYRSLLVLLAAAAVNGACGSSPAAPGQTQGNVSST